MCQIKLCSRFIDSTLVTAVLASIETAGSSHGERLVHFCRLMWSDEKEHFIRLGFDCDLGYMVLNRKIYTCEYFHN